MSLETLFLLRSIDQEESPSVKRLLPTPTAGLLLTPRPAESAPAALFPASSYDHRTADRTRRYPRNPGRSQLLLVAMECRPNPTTLFAPETSPCSPQLGSAQRPKATSCAAARSQPQENKRTAPLESPSTSRETAQIAAWEGAPRKMNSGESSESSPPRKAAAAHATVSWLPLLLVREPMLCAPQSPRSSSSPAAEPPRSKRSQ